MLVQKCDHPIPQWWGHDTLQGLCLKEEATRDPSHQQQKTKMVTKYTNQGHVRQKVIGSTFRRRGVSKLESTQDQDYICNTAFVIQVSVIEDIGKNIYAEKQNKSLGLQCSIIFL